MPEPTLPGGVAIVGGVLGDDGATSVPKGGVGMVGGPGFGGGGEVVCCGGDNCTDMSNMYYIVLLNPPAKLMDVYSSALGRDLNGVCFSVVFALFIRL